MKYTEWGKAIKENLKGVTYLGNISPEDILDEEGFNHLGKRNPPHPGLEIDHPFFLFFPSEALSWFETKNNKEVHFKIKEFPDVTVPLLFVVPKSKEYFDFFLYPLPCGFNFYNGLSDVKYIALPPWNFRSPLYFSGISPLFDFEGVHKEKIVHPYPLYEKYKEHYLPRGIFFPTYKLRSLTFRGTGRIDHISLMNYTSESAKFRWIVPEKFRDTLYWIRSGKKTHEIEVPPYTEPGKVEVDAYIDPGVTGIDKDFVPTVVIMQSKSRLEWLPLPLLRDREEGNFYLKPEEANPGMNSIDKDNKNLQ